MKARAEKAQAESNARFENAPQLGSAISFGQPILVLVGHHSERQHRHPVEQMDNNRRKSVAFQAKAAHLEAKANRVGCAGIALDDPEALQKLNRLRRAIW